MIIVQYKTCFVLIVAVVVVLSVPHAVFSSFWGRAKKVIYLSSLYLVFLS